MPRVNLNPVSKSQVDRLRYTLSALGQSGQIVVTPDGNVPEFVIDGPKGISVRLTAPYIVKYTLDDGVYKLTFDDRVKVHWLFLTVPVSEVLVTTDEIIIQAGRLQARADIQ